MSDLSGGDPLVCGECFSDDCEVASVRDVKRPARLGSDERPPAKTYWIRCNRCGHMWPEVRANR